MYVTTEKKSLSIYSSEIFSKAAYTCSNPGYETSEARCHFAMHV